MALYQIARLLLSGCALCIPWDTQEPIHKMLQRIKFKKFIMAFWDVLFEDEQKKNSVSSNDWVVTFGAALVFPIHKMLQRIKFKKFIMAFWDVLFEDEQKKNSVSSNDWVVTFGAALVLPIVLKLCSNKAQFISMLILVGINFIILKILTLCFFINSIYLYFYFQYISTFNIRKLLLILKYSKDQILQDFYSSSILKGYFYFY